MSIVTYGYGEGQLIPTWGYGQSAVVNVYTLLLTETILLSDILSATYQGIILELAARIYINLLRQTQTIDLLNSHLQPDLHISGTPLNILKTRIETTTLRQKNVLKALKKNIRTGLEI